MCGIAGIYRFSSGSDCHELSSIEQMVKLMARRGPDDQGIWSDGKHCSLGFRRLSILDLTPSGHQPMLTEDRRYSLVFNGELYNFRELRQEIESRGVRFRSTGDAEVVMYALAEWGTNALDRFNGMFALGFYDCRKKSLLLARDHAGIKPLYYLKCSDGVLFASQYDQLLGHSWSRDLSPNKTALAMYLRLGYIPAPYAYLQGTHMVEAGAWVEFRHDGSEQHGRYYKFPMNTEPDLYGEDAYRAVDEAVSAAVRRQLVSDVPVGVFLSGGIDSPLIAAKARQASGVPFKAFTIGIENSELDESSDARQYAHEIGVEHIIEYFAPEQAVGMLDDVVAACSEPFADYSIFPTMLVSEVARRQVKVVLSGDGGDELFWGYTGRFASVLRIAQDFRLPNWIRFSRLLLKKTMGIGNASYQLRKPNIGTWYRTKHHHMGEEMIRSIFPDAPSYPKDHQLFSYQGWEEDRTANWMRWNEYSGHLTKILLKVDRASMFNSLEVRVPLLDRVVIAVASRVDWKSCLDLNRGVGKLPLRHALGQSVTYQTQTKKGFSVPIGEWLRGPLRPIFEDAVLGSQDIAGLPINRTEARKVFDRHVDCSMPNAGTLWVILSLALWHNRHVKNAPLKNIPAE